MITSSKILKYWSIFVIVCISAFVLYYYIPFGNKPSQALGFFSDYKKVILQGSDEIFYVEKFKPFLDGDVAYHLYQGNGATIVAETGKMSFYDEDANNPNSVLRFYQVGEPGVGRVLYQYRPALNILFVLNVD